MLPPALLRACSLDRRDAAALTVSVLLAPNGAVRTYRLVPSRLKNLVRSNEFARARAKHECACTCMCARTHARMHACTHACTHARTHSGSDMPMSTRCLRRHPPLPQPRCPVRCAGRPPCVPLRATCSVPSRHTHMHAQTHVHTYPARARTRAHAYTHTCTHACTRSHTRMNV